MKSNPFKRVTLTLPVRNADERRKAFAANRSRIERETEIRKTLIRKGVIYASTEAA